MTLQIISETKDWLVVNKPAGLTVHRAPHIKEKTLVDFLLEKYPEIINVGDDKDRPGIIQRLDKEASGLMVIAKTNEGFEFLKKQFKARTVKKEYTALAYGKIEKDEDTIDFPIKRSNKGFKMAAIPYLREENPDKKPKKLNNREKGIKESLEQAKTAKTEFKVLQRFTNFTLLKVRIKTGRTHQIRVHLFAYNHPLAGDELYANKKSKMKNQKIKLGRVFLNADYLRFTDLDGEKKEFSLSLPKELEHFLKTLKPLKTV